MSYKGRSSSLGPPPHLAPPIQASSINMTPRDRESSNASTTTATSLNMRKSSTTTLNSNKNGVRVHPVATVVVTKFFNNDNAQNTLNLMVDDVVYVLNKSNHSWWDGLIVDPAGTVTRGWFPPSYTRPIPKGFAINSHSHSIDLGSPKVHRKNLFKDFNSFNHQNSIVSSFNSHSTTNSRQGSQVSHLKQPQFHRSSQPHLNRQQSQPTTTIPESGRSPRSSSFHLVTPEEVNSYFQPTDANTPGFNFIPVWIPEFTKDDDLVYHNSTLNVYTKSMPFLSSETVSENSLFELPDTNTFNGMDALQISLKDDKPAAAATATGTPQRQQPSGNKNVDQERSGSGSIGQNNSKKTSGPMGSGSSRNTSYPFHRDTAISHKNHSSVRFIDPTMFYMDQSDMRDWNQFTNAFKFCVGMGVDALTKNSKQLFLAHLNMISKSVVGFQLQARLRKPDLQRNGHENETRDLLRKLSSSLAQFTINGNLHLSAEKDSPNYLGGLHSESSGSNSELSDLEEVDEDHIEEEENRTKTAGNVDVYLQQTRKDAAKMLNRAESLRKLFVNLQLTQGEDPSSLPLMYPRFARDKFEGGNFKNQFNEQSTTSSSTDLFVDEPSHRTGTRLLLDDSLVDSLLQLEDEAKSLLDDVIKVIKTPVPKEIRLVDFIEDRNLNILTLIYHTLPTMSKVLNISENIDFTVFIMIDKLAKSVPKRHDTITEIDDEASNQQFYETTAKSINPLVEDFMHLKQNFHSTAAVLIMDAQNITVEDPETFQGLRDDGVIYDPGNTSSEVNKLADKILKSFSQYNKNEAYVYDANMKLLSTIEDILAQLNLLILSVAQLKEQRQSVMNYCSRLMNSDFNVASLFIAERHNTLVSSVAGQSEYFFERNQSVSGEHIPWFMDIEEDEKSLIYDSSGLKGGSIASLIAKLVDPMVTPDPEFLETTLTFFATFIKPIDFFNSLIEKFNLQMPEALSYEEYGIWLEKKLKPQQTRVISLFEKLFSKYWIVHYTTPELLQKWESFTDGNPIITHEQRQLGIMVMGITSQQDYLELFGNGNPDPVLVPERPPRTLAVHGKIRDITRIKIKDIDSLELARQITLIQYEYFSKITRTDLLGRTYNFNRIFKIKDALKNKNITKFITNCNQLTHFSVCIILARNDIYERADTIRYFILVAEHLMKMKNFSSMTAIISGLSSTSISRLKKTWDLVQKNAILNFHKMDNLMSIGKNYNEYRNMLKFIDEEDDPSLPFLGMYLSDLRFFTDGNPDHLHSNKSLVNYSKRSNLMKTINEILKFNTHAYNFRQVREIRRFLIEAWTNLPDDETLYNKSLQLEPRVSLLPKKGPVEVVKIKSSKHTKNTPSSPHSYVHPLSASAPIPTANKPASEKKRYHPRAAYGI